MVLGATKNPWGILGPAVRFDERFLSGFSGGAGGREVEAFFGDPSGFPGKIPDPDSDADSDHDYLYIEELPPAKGGPMAEV